MGNTIIKESITVKDLILPGVILIIAIFVLIYKKIVNKSINVSKDLNVLISQHKRHSIDSIEWVQFLPSTGLEVRNIE